MSRVEQNGNEGARERALRRYAPKPVPNLAPETGSPARDIEPYPLAVAPPRLRRGDIIHRPGRDRKGSRAIVLAVRPESHSTGITYRDLTPRDRLSGSERLSFYSNQNRPSVLGRFAIPSDGSGIPPESNSSSTEGEAKMAGRTVVVKNTLKSGGTKSAAKQSGAKSSGSNKANGSKPAAAAPARESKASAVRDKLLKDSAKIAAKLQKGTKMKEIKAEYGLSDDGPVRIALINSPSGPFNAKGVKTEYPAIKATGANLAKRLIKEREQGVAWYVLAFQTGKTEAELKAIVKEAGGDVSGRTYAKGATAGR